MKSIIFSLIALVIATSSCQNVENPNTAKIEFSEPIVSDADFIFSTCGGKKLIITNATAAQKISDNLKEQTGGIFSDMGVGNAFLLNMNGESLLCTATHGTVGLEKYIKKIGADISLISLDIMQEEDFNTETQLPVSYELDTKIQTGDSVFIKGYLFNKRGELQSVTISGKGKIKDKYEYGDNVFNQQYLQDRTMVVDLNENVELGGLSGSPAFNKKGKVIGVYSGRMLEEYNNKKSFCIRISLF